MTPALGVSAWIALTGISAMMATWHVHRTELAHSPEAIESERVRCDYDIATLQEENRGVVARAYAESITLDARTKQMNSEAQRLANLSLLESSKARAAPQRAPVQVYDDSYQDEYEPYKPHSRPVWLRGNRRKNQN